MEIEVIFTVKLKTICENATDAYKINGVESCQLGETEHTTVKEEKWWSMTTLSKLVSYLLRLTLRGK